MVLSPAADVLLAEDSPSDRELTLRGLRGVSGIGQVFVVKDGAEALEFIFGYGAHAERKDRRPPKLILLDIGLPKVDGLAVLRKIKSNQRTRSIPVVMFTSSQDERDVAESYRAGVNSYVVKPADSERFLELVIALGFYWVSLNRTPP